MPVGALPVAMVEPSFFAALIPVIGSAPLIQPGLQAALRAAVAMPAITVRADVEDDVTMLPAARPLPEVRIVMGHRRHRRWRGGQRQSGYVSLGPVLFG